MKNYLVFDILLFPQKAAKMGMEKQQAMLSYEIAQWKHC